MTTEFKEYDVVRVARLLKPERPYEGTQSVARPPRVGDVGSIVHDYGAEGATELFAVEMVDPDGLTVWLADFGPDEIELVSQS
jgi:hypothetical protein